MTNCSIQGCTGQYESKTITHTVRHNGDLMVIDHVPAEVCSVCGDVLLDAGTIRRLETLQKDRSTPDRTVPVYEYAEHASG